MLFQLHKFITCFDIIYFMVINMGSVGKPEGIEGEEILDRMNKSHTSVSLWAMTHFDVDVDDVVLDVGCGGGINLKRLHQKAFKATTYGVDYSSTSVAMSKSFNEVFVDNGEIIVEEADVRHLPFDSGMFDIVTAFETVYFWDDLVASFREVYRALKAGGRFVIVLTANGVYDDSQLELAEKENCVFYTDLELVEYLKWAGFYYLDVFVRRFEDSTEVVRHVNGDDFFVSVVEDSFVDDDLDDGHHGSPEWLCIVAVKGI